MKQRIALLIVVSFLWIPFVQARILFSLIDTPGFYKLSDDLNNSVTISAGDVTFDLGGHTITNASGSGIIITAGLDQVTIRNGNVVGSTDAILVNAGCQNITLEDITAKGAIRGINFENVTVGLISGCEMTLNTTGLELDNSHKITVKDCVASCNTHAAYCLISSTTNFFENCKALSTGEGNTNASDNNVFGFVSANGYGNIFERCIANSTQALSTTDSDSLIAGFALRGSEGCSQIIDSEAVNSQTNPGGFTIPFGILLEATLGSEITLTAVPPVPIPGATVQSVDWSPDGKYLAAGTTDTSDNLFVYQFDRLDFVLSRVATPDVSPGASVLSVDWSPDGRYLAIGAVVTDAERVRIYQFDPANNTLIQVATPNVIPDDSVNSVNWSFDGKYLAAGITSDTDSLRIRIYQFDRVVQTLTQVATPDIIPGGAVLSVNWSPDGKYLAIGAVAADAERVRIYQFDRANNTLIQVATPDIIPGTSVESVNWSFDGKYLAIGVRNVDAERVRIYQFTRSTNSLTQVATPDIIPGDNVFSVNWSLNGKYLAIGSDGADAERVRVYQFDRANNTLTQVATPDIIPGGTLLSVKWSPDGTFIAVGISVDPQRIKLYQALSFPEKNVIKDNTVYCNSGNQCPGGVGISGSSIVNLIIGNTAYSNPIPTGTPNEPIVSSNFQFVTNIFNQLFGTAPSDIQNIALDGCEPICSLADLALIGKQTLHKVCTTILSQLDVIESKIDVVIGLV